MDRFGSHAHLYKTYLIFGIILAPFVEMTQRTLKSSKAVSQAAGRPGNGTE